MLDELIGVSTMRTLNELKLRNAELEERNAELEKQIVDMEGRFEDLRHALVMMEIDKNLWESEAKRNENEVKECHRLMDKMNEFNKIFDPIMNELNKKYDPDKRL